MLEMEPGGGGSAFRCWVLTLGGLGCGCATLELRVPRSRLGHYVAVGHGVDGARVVTGGRFTGHLRGSIGFLDGDWFLAIRAPTVNSVVPSQFSRITASKGCQRISIMHSPPKRVDFKRGTKIGASERRANCSVLPTRNRLTCGSSQRPRCRHGSSPKGPGSPQAVGARRDRHRAPNLQPASRLSLLFEAVPPSRSRFHSNVPRSGRFPGPHIRRLVTLGSWEFAARALRSATVAWTTGDGRGAADVAGPHPACLRWSLGAARADRGGKPRLGSSASRSAIPHPRALGSALVGTLVRRREPGPSVAPQSGPHHMRPRDPQVRQHQMRLRDRCPINDPVPHARDNPRVTDHQSGSAMTSSDD